MFIREATQEDYEEVRVECQRIMSDDMLSAFSRINFVDYRKYLDKLREEFPELEFVQEDYGLAVDKKEA